MMTTIASEMRLAVAEAVVREAGALALGHYRNRDRLVIEGKGLQDIVSIADRQVEALVGSRLGALFPEDGFLGEETGHAQRGVGTWVLDPIDGTWCFLNGIGSWCVSLGYVRDGRLELGVIYDPVANELFSARAGAGATLDGRPIRVSAAKSLRDGTISVGFSHRSTAEEVAPVIERLIRAGGMYHRHGSGALALAWTACGRLIGYVEPHMNSWDAVAGLLLIREAGGWIDDFLVGDGLINGNRVIGCPPAIKTDVLALVEGW